MRTFFFGVAAILLASGCRTAAPDRARLRVAPDGAIDSPAKALAEVLRLRASGEVGGDRRIAVEFACGTYAVDAPLEITAAHGPLLLKGAGPLGTVFSGGRRLGRFKREQDGLTWRGAVGGKPNFDQLFINGLRADLSPEPNRFAPRAPGAWYLDTATHEVVYVARKGESPFSTIAIAGTVATILKLDGASDVSVEGIAFMHNALGHGGGTGAMVALKGSRRISFADCRFEHGASYGLKAAASAGVAVRHSWFEDLGGGALTAAESDRVSFEDDIVANCGSGRGGLAAVCLVGTRRSKVVRNDFCCLNGRAVKADGSVEVGGNRFWKVPGEADSPRSGNAGVRSEDPSWRARVEMLTF